MGACCSQNAAAAVSAPDEMEDEAVTEVLSKLVWKNADDEVMTYVSYRSPDAARKTTMATAFPDVAKATKLLQVTAKKDQAMREFTVVFPKKGLDDPKILMGSCAILMEDLTPAECIEFSFGEEPNLWMMSQLTQDALEQYRGMKFESWKEMLKEPTCEAQFRRMLQIGMISEMYDAGVFPTPEKHKAKFQVKDDRNGKLIELPHPVSGLRVWDAASQQYKAVETKLTGAPNPSDAKKWWDDFMQELKAKHGAEYIDGLVVAK